MFYFKYGGKPLEGFAQESDMKWYTLWQELGVLGGELTEGERVEVDCSHPGEMVVAGILCGGHEEWWDSGYIWNPGQSGFANGFVVACEKDKT